MSAEFSPGLPHHQVPPRVSSDDTRRGRIGYSHSLVVQQSLGRADPLER